MVMVVKVEVLLLIPTHLVGGLFGSILAVTVHNFGPKISTILTNEYFIRASTSMDFTLFVNSINTILEIELYQITNHTKMISVIFHTRLGGTHLDGMKQSHHNNNGDDRDPKYGAHITP